MSALAGVIAARIRADGPISVAEYMSLALGHAEHGYYRTRDPLGRGGDFTTAPEISQVFGEIIGLWCATVWTMMGSPSQLRLVELGPGRGTLMADLVRAARMVPAFAAAAEVHLVETSRPLREKQRAALSGIAVQWHDALDDVPAGPILLVANEFFDALPIHQYAKDGDVWRERLVDVGDEGLRFVLGPPCTPDLPPGLTAENGAIAETCPAARAVAAEIGRRLAKDGGAALAIDYGHAASAAGDTLQAVKAHAFHPVLEDPGEADLTAHVDFAELARAAAPAKAHGPVTQGVWLRRLGAEMRAMQLAKASPAKAETIMTGCARLIDPREMGTLFKVLALADGSLPTLPGFETLQGAL